MTDELKIAVSKGRILGEALPLLARAGIEPTDDPNESRKLVLDTNRADIKLVVLRAADVPTYVELFKAYEIAWVESYDPEVLDQMRKVSIAGLKREPEENQRLFLEEALDKTDELIIQIQQLDDEE